MHVSVWRAGGPCVEIANLHGPSGPHLSDRGYVYLGRRRGQHRPACYSLTHCFDTLPAGTANTPISPPAFCLSGQVIILSTFEILNGRHPSAAAALCSPTNDRPHLALSEKKCRDIGSRVTAFLDAAGCVCVCARSHEWVLGRVGRCGLAVCVWWYVCWYNVSAYLNHRYQSVEATSTTTD